MVDEGKKKRKRVTRLTVGEVLNKDALMATLIEARAQLLGASDIVCVVVRFDGTILVMSSCDSDVETVGALALGQLRVGEEDA